MNGPIEVQVFCYIQLFCEINVHDLSQEVEVDGPDYAGMSYTVSFAHHKNFACSITTCII